MGGRAARCTADRGRGRLGRGTSSGMLTLKGAREELSDRPPACAGAVEDLKAPGGGRSSPEQERSRESVAVAGTDPGRWGMDDRLVAVSRGLQVFVSAAA